MKKLISVLICFCMLTTSVSAMSVQLTLGDTEVLTSDIDKRENKTLTVEAAPYVTQGRTMVPVRIIAESFGAQVGWDDPVVTITKEATEIKLTIGSTVAMVNGENTTLDVAPEVINGRTFVPMRFIGESLGYTVKWVPTTERVLVTDAPVLFKTQYSAATAEEVFTYAFLASRLGMNVGLDDALADYYVLLTMQDYMYNEGGYTAEKAEGFDKNALTELLFITPAMQDVAVLAISDQLWYADIALTEPDLYQKIIAYGNAHPIQMNGTAQEVADRYTAYLEMMQHLVSGEAEQTQEESETKPMEGSLQLKQE